MATQAPAFPDRPTAPIDWAVRNGLWLSIGVAVAVRALAMLVLGPELRSDGLGYFTMARSLAETGVITDQFGQHTFFSPGYPLLLTPFFRVFGAGTPVAHFINLGLAAVSTALVWRLVQALGGSRLAALLGALAFAVWLPAIWNAADLAKENLSTPLLLGFTLCCVHITQGRTDWRTVGLAGLAYGAGLLVGTSIILTGAAFAVALAIALHRTPAAGLRRLAVFGGAALLVLSPWLAASNAMIGRPVITTNGPFNLYIGNNPAANGHFLSIRDTPIGSVWHARIAVLGEAGTSDWLSGQVIGWVKANPGTATALAIKKLGLFWAPNLPDGTDFAESRLLAGLRTIDLVQWAAILVLAGIALFRRDFDRRLRWTIAALVAGFWLIHGATYIIPRYRDPIMPVLIALAALTAAAWLERRRARP